MAIAYVQIPAVYIMFCHVEQCKTQGKWFVL